ncbi:MAG TPA: hypothetical protein VIN08_13275 [Ohtaekwangia sp.]|uniref:hypothetical protein n=1 Tax=Ohtaekwangia sp. TaxID=2066019 RepID=UPI002F95511D
MKISYLIVQLGFVILTFVYYRLLLRELRQALGRSSIPAYRQKNIVRGVTIAIIIWTTFVSILSLSGILSDFNSVPPRIMLVLIIPLISILWITFNRTTADVLQHISAASIIRLQSFRFFVEILLWLLFIEQLLPIQMTFEGRNFDILAGITAPFVAWGVNMQKLPRGWLIVWNILCLALLINIVAIAILSMPTPFRVFMNEPANTVVAKFPIVWLPALLVPLAYGLHFLSLRQLFMKK